MKNQFGYIRDTILIFVKSIIGQVFKSNDIKKLYIPTDFDDILP